MQVAFGRCSFMQYCQSCHMVSANANNETTFRGLLERLPLPADSFLVQFISDSKALRGRGNSYAITIHTLGQKNYDHKFGYVFSQKELAALIAYVKQLAK